MSFLSPNIAIGTLQIGSMEGACAVNVGNNFLTGFHSFKKHNQGFGSIHGDHNQIKGIDSALSESNLIDMINELEQWEDMPTWLQTMINEYMQT